MGLPTLFLTREEWAASGDREATRSYIICLMRRRLVVALLLAAVVASAQCRRGIFRQYEYEEEIYLKLDGSATVIVNTSIAALVALRGVVLDTDPQAAVDRDRIRAFYTSPTTTVTRVSRPWRRDGRRFVQVRIQTDDVRTLGRAAPFAWSTYEFRERRRTIHVRADGRRRGAGAAAARPWSGTEIVSVRMHVPSRIEYHNAPSREVERGNILTWEQPLADRLQGRPLKAEVRMETESILAQTLTIFGLAAVAALGLLAGVVYLGETEGRGKEGTGSLFTRTEKRRRTEKSPSPMAVPGWAGLLQPRPLQPTQSSRARPSSWRRS